MRVLLLTNLNHRGDVLPAGSVVALPADLAEVLLANGAAVIPTSQQKPEPKSAPEPTQTPTTKGKSKPKSKKKG